MVVVYTIQQGHDDTGSDAEGECTCNTQTNKGCSEAFCPPLDVSQPAPLIIHPVPSLTEAMGVLLVKYAGCLVPLQMLDLCVLQMKRKEIVMSMADQEMGRDGLIG